MICVGSPDDCCEYIATLRRFGVDVTFGQFQIDPMPFEQTMASLNQFGTEVASRFLQ